MSHPTFWPKKSFFYPIGNTPPVSLTDHLPPEGAATILLLGCGDPRHILHTITTDHGLPTRSMDFTCCDWEPAILARNALLYTLMYDSVEDGRLLQYWSIFYDLFLDKQTASLLSKQCHKIVEYAADLSTWNDSPYGNFLNFATQDTLTEVRQHWKSYDETIGLSNAKQKQLKQVFLSGMKQKAVEGGDATAIPSAAPLSFRYTNFKTYTKYWSTGITNPTVGPNTPTQVNPTFLFSMSGRRFQLHYGTDLCSSFHLALSQARNSFTDGPISTPAKTERAVWDACRVQFSRWAKAFLQRVRVSNQPSGLIIRLVVGDALAFCKGLQVCQTGDFTPVVYSSAWGGKKFHFSDSSIPTSFDVIDTSNLSDHLGLLNVLTAVLPLLQKSPRAILNTNSLLSYKHHPTKRSALEERALSDFPSLMLFLGITPICNLSGLTFRNCSEAACFSEVISDNKSGHGRHYERVSWRFSDFTHAKWDGKTSQRSHEVRFEPEDFADKLLHLYLKMFESENMSTKLSQMAGDLNLVTMQNPHYHRQSFVRLIKVIRSLNTVEVDWQKAMGRFVELVSTNRELLVGANNFQNLFAEFHMQGVYSEPCFLPGFVAREYQTKAGIFETWETIPPVVCIVLKVPRSALKVLEDMDEDEVGHPILECETFSDMQWHNSHSSIRPIFGDIIESPTNPGKKVIVEDAKGLTGHSPLMVSFFVSSWILAMGNESIVTLCIKSTGADTLRFVRKLGLELRLYSTKISDRDHVFICHERPDNERELQKMAAMNPPPPRKDATLGSTTISLGNGVGRELACKRLTVTASRVKEALMNKASVEIKQVTPFCMEVIIGKQDRYLLFYPIPVDGSRSKTRIARKSSYIEVELPPRNSPLSQTTLQPFPVTQCSEAGRFGLICWNAPYMKIDNLPTVAVSEDMEWISTHLGMCLSHHERSLQRSKASDKQYGPIMNFKLSIGNTFLLYVQKRAKVHFLMEPTALEPFAILFLSSIRFDLSSATIVGDAVIVILEPSIMTLIRQCLRGTDTVTTSVDADELLLWYKVLPVFAERCRQWRHLPTCEYLQRGHIPLSSERGKNPMCSCGKGKNLGVFPENSRWKPLVPHATRIALTPIFPVTYLEDVTEQDLIRAIKSDVNTSTAMPHSDGCENCGRAGTTKLLKCSGCESVKYCSRDCQLADWKRHKGMCKVLGKATA